MLRVDINPLPQVRLNRVPEQLTEDKGVVLKFIIKINFRVEITIFTQFDEVQYNKQCNVKHMNNFRRRIPNNTIRHVLYSCIKHV